MFSLENNVPTSAIFEFNHHFVVSLIISFIVQQLFHAIFDVLFCVREQKTINTRNNIQPCPQSSLKR